MSARASHRRLSVPDLEAILAVTSKLAAPFDLMTMLAEVVNAAKQVLHADRGSVWLYDPAADELVLEIATGIAPVRVPGQRRDRRRLRARPRDHQRPRLLCRCALQSRRGQGFRLSNALHAGPAAHRPQERPGRSDAGPEQDGRGLRRRRRGSCQGIGRPVRGRAPAGAHDRGADRGREDAPGAGDGARGADEHAARRDALAARLRPVRNVAAGKPHRRRHLRPRGARPGSPDRPRATRRATASDRRFP